MRLNLIGPFVVNAPFGTEIAFAKGLRRIGHEVIEVDPNLGSDVYRGMGILSKRADATVVFKSCVGHEDYLEDLGHPIVVYQPDDARFPHIREMMLSMRRYADLFLSFDDHGAQVARTMGYRAAEELLLTADDELYCPSPTKIERDIGVTFIGSLRDPAAHKSRRRMCERAFSFAISEGWKVCLQDEVYPLGSTRNTQATVIHPDGSTEIESGGVVAVYRRSQVVLNHATDVPQNPPMRFGSGYGFQCRHFEVGMTNTPLLTNELILNREVIPMKGNWNSFNSEEDLIRQLGIMLSGGPNVTNLSRQMSEEHLVEIRDKHMPEHRAAQLVDFIRRNS